MAQQERCYDCGKLIDDPDVRRGDHLFGAFKVSLCPGCYVAREAKKQIIVSQIVSVAQKGKKEALFAVRWSVTIFFIYAVVVALLILVLLFAGKYFY